MINSIKEILKYKELLQNLTMKELKLKYRNSALGFFWSFLNPIMLLIVYTFAFKYIMHQTTPNYTVTLLAALLPWQFFQGAVQGSTTSIISNSNLIKKIYFPRQIMPLSIIFSNFVSFLITLVILFGAMIVSQVPFSFTILLLPIILLLLLVFSVGLSLILSSLNVLYRDVSHFVEVLFMLWFYLTPIVYVLDRIPILYKNILLINPMTMIVECIRSVLLEGKMPNPFYIVVILVWDIVLLYVGDRIFRKIENDFAEEV
ncbi:ABC-2 type transport system permease protein [Clostridium acetobutylicum]|uniref:Transport permease protein n=1 Tax=Clostridium acetobutylicum (strain ATCC 824 / DSM 792 / JCM 1419 / IAM 19013 / LMG 5710 / NBRC 13948 / NRRL B-527 / VKM B-1787 / 2291 / W) TaxID=272562 RepID=Q97GN7_CLOAB|nr:ABC transporter permease [Clostridium acetobutylicum]PSM07253.1 ABC transporter permease [Clostridium sp. NJ4]AAK80285.1 Polysaccharide ABC transporter, permease component [Clostridium acetobutylicum ATCC 824]ADZ21380.1 Polysaccharide ABC transporter, permease component [Clostridium acetobutylicum EA 2018]AEI32284.1 polysaccharide ABC transporter permease [Clostridium acetobutylicum DSM 1731]AWV79293.1 ABC transporter permease [Clostridium acetobutylicum]